MLSKLARFCVRRRRLVVFGMWIPLFVGLGIVAGSTGSTFRTDFVLPASESREVQELLSAANPNKAGFSASIVFASDTPITDPTLQQPISAFLEKVDALDGVDVTSPYVNPQQVNQTATIAFARLDISDRSQTAMWDFADQVTEIGDQVAVDGLQIEYGGEVFAKFEMPESEALGLLAAIIILVLAFGSVLAMGLPIGTALLGLGIASAIVTIISNVVGMPDFTTSMVAMVGLGVGIDYALFIVTRYREGLQEGLEVEDAVADAIDTSGRAVLFAGVTVIISLLGLYVMGLSFVRGLATGAAIGVLVMMIASVTLLPALLGMVKHRIDVTSKAAVAALLSFVACAFTAVLTHSLPLFFAGLGAAVVIMGLSFVIKPMRAPIPPRKQKPRETTFWYRWSRQVQRRPWLSLAGSASILIVLSIPLLSIRLGFGDTGNQPESTTVRKAYDLLAEGFGPGVNGPLFVTVQGDTAASPESLSAFATSLTEADNVAFAAPSPIGENVVVNGEPLGLVVVYPMSSPQDEATTDLVHALRNDVIPATGVDAKVGGFTAASVDFADYLGGRLPYLIGAVLILSFILLMAVFRSLLVPLKAVIMNLLSIGAAYGVIVAVFQWGWGKDLIGVGKAGPVESWAPMMLFAIVFGLSMDYEVFLLSRMKEEYDRTKDNAGAVADGLAATARVITAAALIMVCVFAAFVLGDDRQLKLFGLGMAFAVFIDATVVRMLLVPATMELLGDRNWWIPRWLDRLLPKIDVEGHHIAAHHEDSSTETDSRDLVETQV
jgi:RND superfamily putative drug exporter